MTNANRNRKEVLVDFEEKMSLANAATYFEMIAKKLKEEGRFVLTQNGQQVEIAPSGNVELEIKVEKVNDKLKFEMELEWLEGAQDANLIIE